MSENVYSEVSATNEEIEEFIASSNEPTAPEKGSNVFFRILAAIMAVCPFLVLCLLPMGVILPRAAGGYEVFEGSIIGIFVALFTGGVEEIAIPQIFGFLPVLAQEGDFWMALNTVALYAMPLLCVASVALAVLAIVTGKDVFTRLVAWVDFLAIGGYVGSFIAAQYFVGLNLDPLALLYPLILMGVYLVIGLVLSFIKNAKNAGFSVGVFLLAMLVSVVCGYVSAHFQPEFEELAGVYVYVPYVLMSVGALAIVASIVALVHEKLAISNIVSAGLQFAGAVIVLLVFFLNFAVFSDPLTLLKNELPIGGMLVCSIAISVLALVSVALSILNVILLKKAKAVADETEEAADAESVEEVEAAEDAEDVAEAVEEVEETEEATPVEEAEPAEESIVAEEAEVEETPVEETEETVEEEKDYVEGVPYETIDLDEEDEQEEAQEEAKPVAETKIKDEFLLTLTEEERLAFGDLFFLKSKGAFDGVPEYKLEEDNSVFFRKIFLYLGKFRELIPDELLGKMYDFYTKK